MIIILDGNFKNASQNSSLNEIYFLFINHKYISRSALEPPLITFRERRRGIFPATADVRCRLVFSLPLGGFPC